MKWSLSELELKQVAHWPAAAKALLFVILVTALCLAGSYFFIAQQWALLRQAQQQNIALTPVVMQKKAMAESLPAYQQRAAQLVQQELRLLQRLPAQQYSAQVLHDISTLAQQHRLTITHVQWEKEQPLSQHHLPDQRQPSVVSTSSKKAGPTKLLLRISTQGQYHQLGQFVAALSALPRIVLIDSLTLSRPQAQASVAPLNMELLTSTYTYPVMEATDSR
ncbi:MAG: type 4a pilus biogenesis protein PilO [Oceanisphaera sp.]|uniref:type 4a pilus biogenesis protein PilO n=1 Tax=Oceanisphaera sp. TaxID=1929979 RepID=UPI003F96033A